MKVCLLNESFPPVIDGVVNVLMNYADHMREDHGAEVAVGTPRYPDGDYDKYPYLVVPYSSIDTGNMTSGYRAGNPFRSEDVARLAAFAPDIIHSHCPASATIMGRLVREQTDAPLVFTYHTKYDIDIERWVKVKAVAQEGIKAMVSNIEACDEIWTVSRGAGESLKALGFSGDYRVMNNGVDFARGRVDAALVEKATAGYDLPEGVPVFLFVGRLMTYKGLPLILDALKLVADRGQDFRMVFVGKGPDRELMEQKAEALGIRDKCFFTGAIYERDVLRAWNTRADLFLFPSTFDTNGLVVREAAACGLASVLIAGSCAAEGITDDRNGFIIEETPQSMAAVLLAAARDLSHVHQVGQNAMDEIYLSWKDCVSQVYERYEILLDRKKCGQLPVRQKMPSDYLVSMASHTLEERVRFRQIRKELFNDFKDTAVGMMDNIQETTQELEQKAEQKAREHRLETELRREQRQAEAEAAKEQLKTDVQDVKETVTALYDRTVEDLKAAKDSVEQLKEKVKETLE